jgi:alpha-L-arabinofuranosidase
MLILKSENLDGVNSLDNPTQISPQQQTIKLKGKNATIALPARSMSVVKIKAS